MDNSEILLTQRVRKFLHEVGFDEREAIAKSLDEELLVAHGKQPVPGRAGYFCAYLSLGYQVVFRLLPAEETRLLKRRRPPRIFVVELRPLSELV